MAANVLVKYFPSRMHACMHARRRHLLVAYRTVSPWDINQTKREPDGCFPVACMRFGTAIYRYWSDGLVFTRDAVLSFLL